MFISIFLRVFLNYISVEQLDERDFTSTLSHNTSNAFDNITLKHEDFVKILRERSTPTQSLSNMAIIRSNLHTHTLTSGGNFLITCSCHTRYFLFPDFQNFKEWLSAYRSMKISFYLGVATRKAHKNVP